MSIPCPSSREIYSLENLSTGSAAIFLTESGKKLHFTLKSNLGFIFGSLIIQGVLEMLHVSLLLI